jgi:hypothetical protein
VGEPPKAGDRKMLWPGPRVPDEKATVTQLGSPPPP